MRSGASKQGGSTITQQVVKNLLLTNERSWQRKAREAILALKLETTLSKDDILYLYLNHINFGRANIALQTETWNLMLEEMFQAINQ